MSSPTRAGSSPDESAASPSSEREKAREESGRNNGDTAKITPCLWFDTQAEEAAKFYTTIFKNSRISTSAATARPGRATEGMVMTVHFELDGQAFVALNGGPEFTFDEAISFQVNCETQEEIDTSGRSSPRAARRARAAG